jgi:hypothetical protein
MGNPNQLVPPGTSARGVVIWLVVCEARVGAPSSMTRFLYPVHNGTLFARMEKLGEGHYTSAIGSEQFIHLSGTGSSFGATYK